MKSFIKLSLTALLLINTNYASAVTSKVIRHSSLADFSSDKSDTQSTIINSDGVISLAYQTDCLAEDINSIWSINTAIINPYGTIYLGTSPNGEIYQFDGKLKKIYSEKDLMAKDAPATAEPNLTDPNTPDSQAKPLINRHIFALGFDKNSNLLAGISGDKAKLIRFVNNKAWTIFEPNDANYIFDLKTDPKGNIYIATGPKGKIYKINDTLPHLTADTKNPSFNPIKPAEIIFDAIDKSILCIELDNKGNLYAGTDKKGVVYKIDTQTNKTAVLYDSGLTEITGIALDEQGNVYAAATSQDVLAVQKAAAAMIAKNIGKPAPNQSQPPQKKSSGLILNIANTKSPEGTENAQRQIQMAQAQPAGPASHIYKIAPNGIVQSIYSEPVVFFALKKVDDKLIIATGNKGQIYQYSLTDKNSQMIYEDKTSAQILSIAAFEDNIYAAAANPAKLYKIANHYSTQGEYISPLIDAGQPAIWGKFQLQAQIPDNTKITVSARTANIADPNSDLFPKFSDEIQIKSAIDLPIPAARFMQYKLKFQTDDVNITPTVNQTASAYIIPNVAPKILAVSADLDKNKPGIFNITYQAQDDNQDNLCYTIEYKNLAMDKWIQIQDNLDKPAFEWDSKTVQDGRYEIKITASDKNSNDPATELTDSRISDVIVVDNTRPAIQAQLEKTENNTAYFNLTVGDEYSVIGSVQYTINSSKDYISILPDDKIYDMTEESFTVSIDDLKQGTSVITFKATDDIGNTAYKAVEVDIP